MGTYTLEMHLENLKRNIDQAKDSGLKLNVFIIGTKCCSECDKVNGLTFPFEELLQKPFLPFDKCLRKPFCICCYGFQALRDENGTLIEKQY